MANNRRWTKAEDKKIITAVKRSPENLHKAFLAVSKRTDRTPGACSTRWYNYVSKLYSEDVNDACFAIYSKNKYAINRKNVRESTPVNQRTSMWKKIMDFIRNL